MRQEEEEEGWWLAMEPFLSRMFLIQSSRNSQKSRFQIFELKYRDFFQEKLLENSWKRSLDWKTILTSWLIGTRSRLEAVASGETKKENRQGGGG